MHSLCRETVFSGIIFLVRDDENKTLTWPGASPVTLSAWANMNAIHTDELLDHYRIDKLIARSGMASIYRATDTRNDRMVAIKVPHPEM
jgi:hypothetical protein